MAAHADAGLTAYHAVKKANTMGLLAAGTRAVVVGAGGLGHIGIQSIKALSPAEIIVVDTADGALELARDFGADHTVRADSRQVDRVLELTNGTGAEVLFDFVGEFGVPEAAFDMVGRAGSYFVIGYGDNVGVPTIDLISTERSFIGNLVGTYNELVELMTLESQGKTTLHTQTYDLEAAPDAFADLHHGRLRGRGILVPGG